MFEIAVYRAICSENKAASREDPLVWSSVDPRWVDKYGV